MSLAYNFSPGMDNGNLTAITNNLNSQRTENFTYDSTNRIATSYTAATSGSLCWGKAYNIDTLANLYSTTSLSGYSNCGQTQISFGINGINSSNQIIGLGYDAAGNMTNDGTYSYAYDPEGHQLSAAGVNYSYDGDGNRVKKDNGTLYWYGLGDEVLSETDLSGNSPVDYIYFGGKRLARVVSGTVYYYLEDHLGSARINVQAGATTSCYEADFEPYGTEHVVTSNCTLHHKFARMEREAEAVMEPIDHTKARQYPANLGRWLSPDPSGKGGVTLADPQTWNMYAYTRNSPITLSDPSGLSAITLSNRAGNEAGFQGGSIDSSDWFGNTTVLQAGAEAVAMFGVQQVQGSGPMVTDPAEDTDAEQNQSQTQTQQNPPPSPAQKVLTQVQKEFPDLNVSNVKDLKAHNGHENISVTGSATNDQMAQIKKTLADNAGLFGPGSRINIEIGNGTYALHVEFAQFNSSGDTGTVRFQSHIDVGNPNAGPVGLLKHVFVDGLVGAVFHHNDPGLDPQ